MLIREATKDDFEQICHLITTKEDLFWIYPRGSFPFTEEQLQALSEQRRDLTVAIEDGKVIGFANLYDFEPDKHAFIGNVAVSPKARGKGFGRKLVSTMLDIVRDKYALPEVRISVFSDNVRALLLYSSFGFMPYQVEERRDFSGRRVALLHMRLEMTSPGEK